MGSSLACQRQSVGAYPWGESVWRALGLMPEGGLLFQCECNGELPNARDVHLPDPADGKTTSWFGHYRCMMSSDYRVSRLFQAKYGSVCMEGNDCG